MTDVREEKCGKPLNAGAFMANIGPLLKKKDQDGDTFYALETTAQHANALGLVHGGVIASLLDQAIAMVAWTAAGRVPTVTVQLDTRFVSAAKPGVELQARANMRHRSTSMMFLDAEILDGNKVIALATAVMKISRKAS